MKAFVQTHTDGEFFNANFFDAWRAFNWFGYDVVKFKPEAIEDLEITSETPVYAGTSTTRRLLHRIGVTKPFLPSYPKELNSLLKRSIRVEIFGDIIERVAKGEALFIKPLDEDRKLFDGFLARSLSDLSVARIDLNREVYCSPPMDFLIECRAFILNKSIVDSRPYRGNFRITIAYYLIEQKIRELEFPVAYCLDLGYVQGMGTVLVEATDAFSFGNYGLEMTIFGRMIIDRWAEICKV